MRRPPPGEPPHRRFRRDVPRPEGPFERLLKRKPERDPAPIIIGGTIGFLALVIVLVFAISSLSGGGGNGGGGGESREIAPGVRARQAEMPALPPGLIAMSEFIELEAEEDTAAEIGLQLKDRVQDGTGLGFYTFSQRRWQRISDISKVEQDGRVAFGDFRSVPENFAVLRVIAETYRVAASLPAGGSLHPEASAGIVSPRDYAPLDDASLQGSASPVEAESGMLVMPTIVGSGQDTAAIVDDILSDEKLRARHVQEILSLVSEGGFDGIDLEYSAVDADLKSQFTSFVRALAEGLQGKNKRLSLTLPPPGNQRQAYDWAELGNLADVLRVLPIADPETYWETMPDALGRVVEQVAEPRKVLLVLSPFSIENAGGFARPIGYVHAMALAAETAVREPQDPNDITPGTTVRIVARNLDESEGASPLKWSDSAAAVSFALGGTERRRIYIENTFSFRFKLEMVQAYGLGGVSVSDGSAQSDVANVWPTLQEFLSSATVTLRRPNDSTLLPTWQAPDGGDLGAGAGTTATWIAPDAGQYNVLLVVSDGERRFARQTLLEVKKGPEPSPTPIETFAPDTPTPTPEETATPTPTPPATASPTPRPAAFEVGLPDTTGTVGNVVLKLTIDNNGPTTLRVLSIQLTFGTEVISNIECLSTFSGKDVRNITLEADDGDSGGFGSGGPDEVVCEFSLTPGSPGEYRGTITVVAQDGNGNQGTASDDATITITTP